MQIADIKGGPVMKAFSEKLVDWQLEFPNGTKEEAEAFVKDIAEGVKAEFTE